MFENTIFDAYPYLLPNLVCTVVVVFGLSFGILFLEETHEDKKHDTDRGREIGQWLLRKVWRSEEYTQLTDKDEALEETTSMLNEHSSNAYRSTNTSPTLCSSRGSIDEPPPFSLEKGAQASPKVREAFTKQVILNIVGYGILAL